MAGNILSADSSAGRFYKHSGFTSTISDSFSSPSTSPVGSAWDGTNVISGDSGTDKYYIHSGFSSTVSDSFSSPANDAAGANWDSSNLVSSDTGVSDLIYKHSGFTSTISDSFSSPSVNPSGVADDSWDGVVATIALTGTVTASITESDIVTGGKTIILTISHDTWVAAGGTFDGQRQAIIDGIDSAQSEATGWDLVPKATQGVAGVVRTSNTVVTITLDAFPTYNITAQETITATIPATALIRGIAIVASPTFTINPDGAPPPPPTIVGWKTLLGVGQG